MKNLNQLLQIAEEKKASDLHLAANYPPFLRIEGELNEIENEPELKAKDVQNLISNILTPEQKEKFLKEKDLDFAYAIGENSRFRVNIHQEKNNMGFVARVIPSTIPTMEEIQMPDVTFSLTKLLQGLILVTGPTGCGKSTTMAAMINKINQERRCHIITLEDPIEFTFKPKKSIIKQRQLGTDMTSFGAGLKHILRQDPNVIMVGEMRDLETIAAAITLAETGHLVIATLHTYSAAQTIDRIIDIFPPYQQKQIRMQLSLTLSGVISQRLLPRVSGGRVAAREILISTPAISNLIRENKIAQIKTAIQTGAAKGMISLNQNLKELLNKKQITKETASIYMN